MRVLSTIVRPLLSRSVAFTQLLPSAQRPLVARFSTSNTYSKKDSSDSAGPGQGYARESPHRVSGPDDPKAKEQAKKAGVSPEVVAEKQNTGTSADNIPYDKKKAGGQKGGSVTGDSH